MKQREFFYEIVGQLREAQKSYFATRDKQMLNECIRLENIVDAELEKHDHEASEKPARRKSHIEELQSAIDDYGNGGLSLSPASPIEMQNKINEIINWINED